MSPRVITNNENKREEMTEIVETLHQYVSGHGDHLFKILMNPIFSSYSLLQIIPSGTMWRRPVNCSKRTSDVQLLILHAMFPFDLLLLGLVNIL